MFERVKFFSSAVLGLLLGIVLALPLFWFAVKMNIGSMYRNTQGSFEQVVRRQQAMADTALDLEKRLMKLGYKGKRAAFAHVEIERSKLAGDFELSDRIELTQDLEGALLEAEDAWKLAPKALAKDPFVHQFGLTWMPMKRYLVSEEDDFGKRVADYNDVLKKWPVAMVIGHRSFAAMAGSLVIALRDQIGAWLRQGLSWIVWACKAAWAKVTGAELPEKPKALPMAPPSPDALFSPLPLPAYVAEAPKPEEDYEEIQYSHEMPSMADVPVGGESPVLENQYRPDYQAPVPKVQRTVIYK
jgi:hypothetical protein